MFSKGVGLVVVTLSLGTQGPTHTLTIVETYRDKDTIMLDVQVDSADHYPLSLIATDDDLSQTEEDNDDEEEDDDDEVEEDDDDFDDDNDVEEDDDDEDEELEEDEDE